MKVYRWLKDFTVEENVKRLTAYYLQHAIRLAIKNPEKTVKKLIIDNRYTAGRILQSLERMSPIKKEEERLRQIELKNNMKKDSSKPYYSKKIKSKIIECTARVSPACLRTMVQIDESTVCVRCKLFLKQK